MSLLEDRWCHFSIARTTEGSASVFHHRVTVRISADPSSHPIACSTITLHSSVENTNDDPVVKTMERSAECKSVIRTEGGSDLKSWFFVDVKQTQESFTETYAFALIERSATSPNAIRRLHPLPSDLDVLRYIASHRDLIAAFGTDTAAGRQHYFDWGRSEGRTISFDPKLYLHRHVDLQYAIPSLQEACEHYIRNGSAEGRATS